MKNVFHTKTKTKPETYSPIENWLIQHGVFVLMRLIITADSSKYADFCNQ